MRRRINAHGSRRSIAASVERELSRLARSQEAREERSEPGGGEARRELAALLTWVRSPGISRVRRGASADFAQLRWAAVLDAAAPSLVASTRTACELLAPSSFRL